MIVPAPARTGANHGERVDELFSVTSSVARYVVSVLADVRPSPGKCLSTDCMPALRAPRTQAAEAAATLCPVEPNWRSYRPIGGLDDRRSYGTTSVTGARLVVKPLRRSWRLQTAARRSISPSGSRPCRSALGMSEMPGPRRPCTAPPSWSRAMNEPTPPVAAAVVCCWTLALSDARAADPSSHRPAQKIVPTPYRAMRSDAVPTSRKGTPTASI